MNKTTFPQLERFGELCGKASRMSAEEKIEAKALQQAMREDGLTIRKIGPNVVISDDDIEVTIRKFHLG